MSKKHMAKIHRSRKRKRKARLKLIKWTLVLAAIFAAIYVFKSWNNTGDTPESALKTYMACIINKDYEKMYEMISKETKKNVDKETYLSRNKNIYEGIEIKDLNLNIIKTNNKNGRKEIIYQVTMNTVAGEITFPNTSYLSLEDGEYKLNWSSTDIFPELQDNYKVRVETIEAERGKILDRNGTILAGKQTASQIGIVPGKMDSQTKKDDITRIANLLDISEESINRSLSASYVAEDTFVPLKTIRKSEQTLKNSLLEIKGIKIIDKNERIYPLGEATSHLVGYIQSISKEELEEKKNDEYNEQSIIGKTGIEKIYENRLRAINGAEIYIINEKSNKLKTLARKEAKNGEDIKLTIDSKLQEALYEQFQKDKSASVAINPKTGEVLALVSTPTFDSNDFSLGMTNSKWESLSNDSAKPLYTRFTGSYAPGSSMKPIIGAIGLDSESFSASEDFGPSGTRWRNDTSWGDFYVSTLTTYEGPANLQNALIYSDNIYFAKAAVKIGKTKLANALKDVGFDEEIKFAFSMDKSIYSNTGDFLSEQQLANTGYGQAEVLVNPIHMAMIYSSFANSGNMIMPYIEYKQVAENPEYYKRNAFGKTTANEIKNDLIQVVENPGGTAYSVHIEGKTIAGKTGTAEIKSSKGDQDGTEIGWFNSFIADENSEKQLLIVSMVEDVKGRGGSHYLLQKIRSIYENY